MSRRFQFSADMLILVACVVAACLTIGYDYRLTLLCWARGARQALTQWKEAPFPPPTFQDLAALAIVLSPFLWLALLETIRAYNQSRDEGSTSP